MFECRSSLIYDTGTIKLADFGLSKSLPVNKHASYDLESKFKLTGETGSYRYMAPEVFRHEPYNFKVDVYSFSMIAFQLFEHCPPFAGMDPVEAAKHAALHDRRPAFNKLNDATTPYPVSKLLRQYSFRHCQIQCTHSKAISASTVKQQFCSSNQRLVMTKRHTCWLCCTATSLVLLLYKSCWTVRKTWSA